MQSADFTLRAIPLETAAALRKAGGPVSIADATPGYPCRQCLRDAEIGEALILVAHDPFILDSPYRRTSPIFLHRDPCPPWVDTGVLPAQMTGRTLTVHSFDDDEMMIDAALVEGIQAREAFHALLADPAVRRLDVHNVPRGCWAVSVVRN